MPKIQPYEIRTQTSGAVPQGRRASTNYDPLPDLNAAIQGGAKGIDYALQRASQEDVSNANLAFSKIHVAYTKKLLDAQQTGDLDTEKFIQSWNDDVDQNIKANINTPAGQQYYKEQHAIQSADLSISAAKLKISLAGELAASKMKESLDLKSASLIDNPSGLFAALASANKTIDADTSIPFNQKLKFKTLVKNNFVEAEVRGWVKKTPEYALELLASGRRDAFLSGDLKHQLEGEAHTRIKARQQEEDRARLDQKRIKEEKQNLVFGDFLNRFDNGSVPTQDILNAPIEPQLKEHLLAANEKVAKNIQVKAYGQHFLELYRRTLLPDTDPNKIVDDKYIKNEIGQGRINTKDGKILLDEIAGKTAPDSPMIKDLKSRLFDLATKQLNPKAGPMNPYGDAEGLERMQAWASGFYTEFASEVGKGKKPQELLTPSTPQFPNPNYIGKSIHAFAPASPNEVMRANFRTQTGSISGLIYPGNIELTNRPQIPFPPGGTFLPIAIQEDDKGNVSEEIAPDPKGSKNIVLIPTISDDGNVLSPKEAIAEYKASGKQLGIFRDEKSAKAYSKVLHQEQEAMLSNPMRPGETPYQYRNRMLYGPEETTHAKPRQPGESIEQYDKRVGNK